MFIFYDYVLTVLQQAQPVTDHFKPIQTEGLFWEHVNQAKD